jgi:ABC-type branched-subunit amino acid transport system substrate-binding protein
MKMLGVRIAMATVIIVVAACGSANTAPSGSANNAPSGSANTAPSGSANNAPSGSANTAPSGSANTGPPDKELIIGEITPFSGPNAVFGLEMDAACTAAVQVINADGGALGHTFKCVPIDSKGDAADGVLAVTRALAEYSNMVGVIGPGTDAATATMPLLEQAQLATIGANGDVSFNHNSYKYYWRITPSDTANAVAMVGAGQNLNYKRAALVFGNDAGAQTNVPGILHSWPIVGGTITDNESLASGQPSYQTEAAKVAASNPDVIFTETDPQTAATFFGQLKQMGKLVPIFGTNTTIYSVWYQALRGAIGSSDLQKYFRGVEQYAPPGPGYDAWKSALLAVKSADNPGQYLADPFGMSYYDSVNMLVLAMIKAGSVAPSVYNSAILSITNGGKVVNNFVDGAAVLNAGTDISYVGALGPIVFDQYHNSSGEFAVVKFNADGSASDPLTIITPGQIQAAQ